MLMDECHLDKPKQLLWEAHACLPLHSQATLKPLLAYQQAKVSYVSINVGMDMNPLTQIMETIAHFRSKIRDYPQLRLAKTLKELRDNAQQDLLSVGFDLEGALPLLENPEMVFLYRDLGVRQIHLAYNRNNSIAGGCHDPVPQGLTTLGRVILKAMNQAGVIVDCSHMSKDSALDILSYSETPPVFSHSNPHRITMHERNIDDDILKAVKERSGVVCLNGVNLFLGQTYPTIDRFIDHLCYVVDQIGVEHVGIGLDVGFQEDGIDDTPTQEFDASYWWPETAGYRQGISTVRYLQPETWLELPKVLQKKGFNEEERAMVLGENMARVLEQVEKCAQY